VRRSLARKYAHDAVVRCVDHWLADDEWLANRFTADELQKVRTEIMLLRAVHHDRCEIMPDQTETKR
jgi:hypothetical protein